VRKCVEWFAQGRASSYGWVCCARTPSEGERDSTGWVLDRGVTREGVLPGHERRCWGSGVGSCVGSVYVVVAEGCLDGMWSWSE
jgi:hypothetical protein